MRIVTARADVMFIVKTLATCWLNIRVYFYYFFLVLAHRPYNTKTVKAVRPYVWSRIFEYRGVSPDLLKAIVTHQL